jgi:hypothetical protein
MLEVMQHILTAIGAVIGVGGGIAVVSYGLLRFFGEKWLSARFEERLAAYKHAQQKELEELRFKINALMDRTIKLHQKEFDVLPEAWGRLVETHGLISSITSPLQSYPDLDQMTGPQLEEFLEKCPLANWQNQEVRNSPKRTDSYMKAIAWHKIAIGREKTQELYVFLRKNGIFIPEPTKSKFTGLEQLIYNALIEYEINQNHQSFPRRLDDQDKLRKEGEPLVKALEKEVQDRLWSAQKA